VLPAHTHIGPSWPVLVLNFTFILGFFFNLVYVGLIDADEMSKFFKITSSRITKARTRRTYFSLQNISDAIVLTDVRGSGMTNLELCLEWGI
jgi:uncharacterized membrane protein (DUF106 family)